MTNREEKLKKAFDRGVYDTKNYMVGSMPFLKNCYPYGSIEYDAWQEGSEKAFRDMDCILKDVVTMVMEG